MFQLVVFDLDGTLIDSRRDLAESANELLAWYGAPTLPVDSITVMVGEGARRLVERACAASGLTPPPDGALERFLEIYDRRLFDHTRCYDGVESVVAALATRVTLAVLTNKPGGPTERLLERFGLRGPMAFVVAGDGPYARKPDPAGLAAIMRATGAEPRETLLVGDSWIDFDTAASAGTRFCLARYGFGSEQFPLDRRQHVELAIDQPNELVGLVCGHRQRRAALR